MITVYERLPLSANPRKVSAPRFGNTPVFAPCFEQIVHRVEEVWKSAPSRLRIDVQGAGCRVQSAEGRVQGAGCRALSCWYRVQGAGCKVQGSGCRVQGAGL